MGAPTTIPFHHFKRLVPLLAAVVFPVPIFLFAVTVIANTVAGEPIDDAPEYLDDVDDEFDDLFDELDMAAWEESDDGAASVLVRVPTTWPRKQCSASLKVTALFGALETRWRQQGYKLEPGDELRIDVEPPQEAFLHSLAETYVTELRVRATVCGASGSMPDSVLAWPDGPAGEPVIWTIAQMESYAPYGVLDPTMRAAAATALGRADRRLGPPVTGVAERGRQDTGMGSNDQDASPTAASDADADADQDEQE